MFRYFRPVAKQLLIVNDFNSNDFLCTNYPSGAKLNWRGQGNTKLRTDNNFQENDETKADWRMECKSWNVRVYRPKKLAPYWVRLAPVVARTGLGILKSSNALKLNIGPRFPELQRFAMRDGKGRKSSPFKIIWNKYRLTFQVKQALQAVVEKSLGREAAAEARRRPERTGVADLQLCSSMVPN